MWYSCSTSLRLITPLSLFLPPVFLFGFFSLFFLFLAFSRVDTACSDVYCFCFEQFELFAVLVGNAGSSYKCVTVFRSLFCSTKWNHYRLNIPTANFVTKCGSNASFSSIKKEKRTGNPKTMSFHLLLWVCFNLKCVVYRFKLLQGKKLGHECDSKHGYAVPALAFFSGSAKFGAIHEASCCTCASCLHRCFSTAGTPAASVTQDTTAPEIDVPTRIKFKRLDKTARHIMQVCLSLLQVVVHALLSFLCSIQFVPDRFWIKKQLRR